MMTTKLPPKRFSLLLAVAAGVTVIVLLLAGWETYLRWRYPSPFSAYIRDTELEYRVHWDIPGDSAHLNFRGRVHTIEKVPGTTRILALGGSTTNGYQMASWKDAWPGVLESELRQKGVNAEVINVGELGYSCEHIRVVAKRLIPALKPDLVIFMEGWNWCGIREPLNWSPFTRLPPGFQWLQPLADSRIFDDIRGRSERLRFYVTGHKGMPPDVYMVLRLEQADRLTKCLSDLNSYLDSVPVRHMFVIPPALFPLGTPTPATLAPLAEKLGSFNYCDTHDPAVMLACHNAERESMRLGFEQVIGPGGNRPIVIDGDQMEPSAPEDREQLFKDYMHLNERGNGEFGKYLAEYIERVNR